MAQASAQPSPPSAPSCSERPACGEGARDVQPPPPPAKRQRATSSGERGGQPLPSAPRAHLLRPLSRRSQAPPRGSPVSPGPPESDHGRVASSRPSRRLPPPPAAAPVPPRATTGPVAGQGPCPCTGGPPGTQTQRGAWDSNAQLGVEAASTLCTYPEDVGGTPATPAPAGPASPAWDPFGPIRCRRLSSGPRLSQTDELALRAPLSGTKVEICVTRDPRPPMLVSRHQGRLRLLLLLSPRPAYSRTGVLALLPHKDVQRLPATKEEERREEDAVRPGQVVSGAFAAGGSVGGDPAGRGAGFRASVLGQAAARGRKPAAGKLAKRLSVVGCEGMGQTGFAVRFRAYFRSGNGDGGKGSNRAWSHC